MQVADPLAPEWLLRGLQGKLPAALREAWQLPDLDLVTIDFWDTLVVRTRYQRYIGEYVLHCHILDHEDQGMMQNVRVLLPDGQGGAVGNGHH